ncbi:MAG: hypothetical protein KDB04_00575 [Acidimicrobiales bacterium]|nr:hypothetical protein [Acidimicrobiales bacterium]
MEEHAERTVAPRREGRAMETVEERRRTGGSSRPTEPPRASLAAKVRYRFDLALARGPLVVIGYLGLVMLAIIAAASVIMWVLRLKGVNGGEPISDPFDAFWQALLRVVDSGTFAADATWPTRLLGLLITLCGIFLAGSLIGLIATAVDQQIERLRKGRSRVLEHGHTLVLGWSPRLPTVLSELVEANANHRRAAVVVLSHLPKDEMEDELRVRVPDTRTTRVVCRTGDPSRPADLDMVNLAGARSVIVLAGDDGDAGVVKAVLAVRSVDPQFAHAHVVAEMEDAGNADTLRALTEGRIVTVRADDIIAELTAQACHQAGLAAVFRELLDFRGGEIYFTRVPELDGVAYADALLAFGESSVLGWVRPDGVVELNPDPAAPFPSGAEVITVSEDDDRVVFTGLVERPQLEVDPSRPYVEPPQHVLIIGWSDLGPAVVAELDEFMAPGSNLDLVVDPTLAGCELDALDPPLPPVANGVVRLHEGGRGPHGLLAMLAQQPVDQAIVLGYRGAVPVPEADARTMLTLLTLDKAFAGREERPRVVAEVLDRANVAVAQTTGVSDFIVSDELSSLMIAQLAERLELHRVFDELFDAEGCFLTLNPAALYAPDGPVAYAEVVAAASVRRETALGWRIAATGTVVVNPSKSTRVQLGAADQVLVLAPR